MSIIYKRVPEKDKEALFALIDSVIKSLPDPSCFIPYEDWEFERMFDQSYAFLYGAYANGKLVGIAQMYVEEKMLADVRKSLGLNDCKLAELGGNLVSSEYRGNGITTSLIKIQLDLAKSLGYEKVIAYTHPKNKEINRLMINIGMELVDSVIVGGFYPRNLYMITLSK